MKSQSNSAYQLINEYDKLQLYLMTVAFWNISNKSIKICIRWPTFCNCSSTWLLKFFRSLPHCVHHIALVIHKLFHKLWNFTSCNNSNIFLNLPSNLPILHNVFTDWDSIPKYRKNKHWYASKNSLKSGIPATMCPKPSCWGVAQYLQLVTPRHH